MRSDHIIPACNYSKIFNVIIDMDYWRNKDPVLLKDALIWFTDGSRTDLGKESGIYGLKPNKSYSFSLGKFVSVLQTEIYAILRCAYENIRRASKNKRILTFSDSQAALKVPNGPKVISRLVKNARKLSLHWQHLTRLPSSGCQGIMASWETKWLIRLLDKHQLCRYLVQSRLLEYLSVCQERQSRAGLSIKTQIPEKLFQVADKASFL